MKPPKPIRAGRLNAYFDGIERVSGSETDHVQAIGVRSPLHRDLSAETGIATRLWQRRGPQSYKNINNKAQSEEVLMQSKVLVLGLSGNLGKKETGFNERIAEKEREGWEVVDMQVTRPSFGYQPIVILRFAKESN